MGGGASGSVIVPGDSSRPDRPLKSLPRVCLRMLVLQTRNTIVDGENIDLRHTTSNSRAQYDSPHSTHTHYGSGCKSSASVSRRRRNGLEARAVVESATEAALELTVRSRAVRGAGRCWARRPGYPSGGAPSRRLRASGAWSRAIAAHDKARLLPSQSRAGARGLHETWPTLYAVCAAGRCLSRSASLVGATRLAAGRVVRSWGSGRRAVSR